MEAIGRFVVLERIGVGAHAAVYRAEDPVLDQLVALKVLSTHVAFDPDGRARFIGDYIAAGGGPDRLFGGCDNFYAV